MNPWLLAVLGLIIGLALVLRGRGMRSRRGLGQGRTLDLDSRTRFSARLGLAEVGRCHVGPAAMVIIYSFHSPIR